MRTQRTAVAVLGAAAALALAAGCATADENPTAADAPSPTTPVAAVTVTDPWVKTTAKGMTAAFGTLTNNTDREITVVSAGTPASATVELHEVAMAGGKMVMRRKAGGFAIAAHATHQLAPGGDHIMLLAVKAPVKPGEKVAFTLRLDDGSSIDFTAVAKDFAGGNENYQPGGQDGMSLGGMNSGGHG